MIGYYEEQIFREFIKDSARELPKIKIQYLREYQALGTAGGLYHFRDAILKGGPERFFVLNADVCCSFPLEQMLKLFESKDAEAVILGTRVSNDAATNFGCIVSDPDSKRVLHYVEKPESHISNLINCGVYLFSTETIFPAIKSAIKRRADRPRLVSYPSAENLDATYLAERLEDGEKNEVLRLEQDILSDLADSNQFFVLETKDFWRQIKTAGSAVPANALYLQKAFQSQSEELAAPSATILPPVFIHPTAEVDPTAKLGPNVSIGPRAVIGAGVRVKESIVLEDTEIKHDACVLYSIIGWNSRVGAWARVEGTPTPVGSHTTSIVKNGVKVQSITILGKDCGVGDEVRVQNCVCLPNKELKRVCCVLFFPLRFSCDAIGFEMADSGNRMSATKSSCERPRWRRISQMSHAAPRRLRFQRCVERRARSDLTTIYVWPWPLNARKVVLETWGIDSHRKPLSPRCILSE